MEFQQVEVITVTVVISVLISSPVRSQGLNGADLKMAIFHVNYLNHRIYIAYLILSDEISKF